jgi:HD-GYP domain-containing protein (c-di-GMP phosphodiesterase class II)
LRFFPIPVALLELGKPLPVDVWSASGKLLLKKGQSVDTEEDREKLRAHNASSTLADALAWQRSYERTVRMLLREGADVQEIARLYMPTDIPEIDRVVDAEVKGGWLDMQEVLRGILYQCGLAINPIPRLVGIEKKVFDLLQSDVDDSLFCLFQALADDTLGYCATHALLCAVVCNLTANKLGLDPEQSHVLLRTALTMNIGMARDQDRLARQNTAPSDSQREIIRDHSEKSVEILRGFGIDDENQLDIVRWHHTAQSNEGLPHTLASRRILAMTDGFVAKMAARKTRSPMLPVTAVRSMIVGAQGDAIGVGSAMAQAVGFYPPGTYVQLVNGETAVAVQRGARANTPWVISIVGKDGIPLEKYVCKDTSNPTFAIDKPLSFEKVRVMVSLEKVRKARAAIPR